MPQTGATRYQKFLKSEKGKTKLKAKKDLPRGTNVTKTNFKVKKIVLKEQLKKHAVSEALSGRKLNVKELLSRLNHFNTNSRTDALEGLKELVTSYPGVLDQSLGQLIHGVTPLVLNVEKTVRRESLKLLHSILSNANVHKTEPFYEIMSTYLRSAMTHIDNRIQEDSLLFLDVLLLCTPEKVAQDFHKIIPNFLDMISKLRIDSKPGRTLTVNLNSQITSVKWRVKVLNRLHVFLQKYVSQNNIGSQDKPTNKNLKFFDNEKSNNFDLFNPVHTTICQLNCFSMKNLYEIEQLDEVEKFKEYIETLIPLLFETWLEVCPNVNTEKNIETVVSEDAAILLKHTLEVFTLIWELVHHLDQKNPGAKLENLFCQNYRAPFNKYFIYPFPFVTNIRAKQTRTSAIFEDVVTDPKLVAENLDICHLFIKLNSFINIKTQNREISSVLNYIEKTFNQNTQDNINDSIISILHTIFSDKITSWTKTYMVMDALFRKIIWAYFNKDIPNSFKQKIFAFLCKIALDDKFIHFHKSEAYEKWLINIPDILLEGSINVKTVDILQQFAVRSNTVFNSVIIPKLLKVIEILPKLVITDAVDDPSSYCKLYSTLYWIKNWDNESLNLLERQLIEGHYKSDHSDYILQTLKLKTDGLL